ncbi:MAG: hypothetical protein WCY05_07745, partial [Candidatus Omnitrophota bacterium]
SNASKAWGAISSALKGSWNQYAAVNFSPKKPKAGVSYSGASAYTSHLQQIENCTRALNGVVKDLTPVTPVTISGDPFRLSTTAPLAKFSAQISNEAAGEQASIELESVAWDLTNNSGLTVKFTAANSGVEVNLWADFDHLDVATDELFGYAFYAKKRSYTPSSGQTQINPLFVACIEPVGDSLEFTEGTPKTGYGFTVLPSLNLADSKYPVAVGDNITIEAYAISQSGASAFLGSKNCTVA